MRRWIGGLSLLVIATGFPVSAGTLTSRVVGVHKGDTPTLLLCG